MSDHDAHPAWKEASKLWSNYTSVLSWIIFIPLLPALSWVHSDWASTAALLSHWPLGPLGRSCLEGLDQGGVQGILPLPDMNPESYLLGAHLQLVPSRWQ